MASRIVSIANFIDTMLVTKKHHAEKTTVKDIIYALSKKRGSQFDPQLVDIAIKVLKDQSKFMDILAQEHFHFVPYVSLSFRNSKTEC